MHNVTFISNVTTPERAYTNAPGLKDFRVKFFSMSDSTEKILAEAGDTEFLIADAMAKIDGGLIGGMKHLRLIQSEGVGYQGVDLQAARQNGVLVCNNKGINDTAVAESAVMLILSCLKDVNGGRKAVYEGRQMAAKKAAFGVVRELSECTVGLLGFGDIARETARLLSAFGARVLYANRTRYADLEEQYHAVYVSLPELLRQSDFVSLHLAVCDDTREMVNEAFLSAMKDSAYLINTARGDLVDNAALLQSLLNGTIAGAGLDVISPEPVEKDNLLLDERVRDKLVVMPHTAGITSLAVQKVYKNSYENIISILNGRTPRNVVG